MPLLLNHDLPVYRMLLEECPEVLGEEDDLPSEQVHEVLLLNLMSDKVSTEMKYLRCLGGAKQWIRVELMRQISYLSPNQDAAYLKRFYRSLEEVRHRQFDALIITGAPLEHILLKKTLFWEEFCRILDWSRTNVHTVLYTCWSAFGGLYHDYGIEKIDLDQKYLGIYDLLLHRPDDPLFDGCGEELCIPLSRATDIDLRDLAKQKDLILLASAVNETPVILKSADSRRFYITGHPEYDRDRLAMEYERDLGKKYDWIVPFPVGYFPNDDRTKTPTDRWIAPVRRLFSNFFDHYVDKSTAINRKTSTGKEV